MELTLMKFARQLMRGKEVQIGSWWPTPVTPWRRRDLACCVEGQEKIGCSKVSGFKRQSEQEVAAAGTSKWGGRPGSFSGP